MGRPPKNFSRSAHVCIEEATYIAIYIFTTAGLPLIRRDPQDQFVNNRQTATFECFANGSNSTLSVTWERNRNQYNSGNLENTVHSNGVRSILTINTATVSDDGKYRCRATNYDEKSAVSNEADLISMTNSYYINILLL